jgi:TolB protein
VLTSSSILLLIATLIFWPILQFKVSPVSADDSTPHLPTGTLEVTAILTHTPTYTPHPTATATPIPTSEPTQEIITSTETQIPPQPVVSTPLQSGLIVLAMYEAGHSHLFAYHAMEVPFTRLTSGPWDDTHPALSPDGRWLAFASNRSGPWDIYLLDLDNGEVSRLTETEQFESSPSWSPDGNLIAYERYAEESEVIIQSVFDDQTLINLSEHPAEDYQPTWSPLGRQLAFISTRSGDAEVWLADFDKPDSQRFSNLSNTPEIDESNPIWSPMGTSLAWAAAQASNRSVFVWEADADRKYVGSGDWPVWSPDGTTILTSLGDSNHTLLTAYRSSDGRLELPPVLLPGQVTGLTWNDQQLPSPLPQNLQQISAEDQSLPWLSPNAEHQANLVHLAGVQAPFPELHDSADDAFQALRAEVSSAAGWDFLATLENAFVPLTAPLPPGLGEDWLYTGRAFAFDTLPMNAGWVVAVPENYGHEVYWRIFIKARFQNGSLGKPMRQVPWNFNARFEGDPLLYEQGGRNSGVVPTGYWIDFTQLALAFGWQRIPALPTWQSAFYAARFNEFVVSTNQSWDQAMLDIYPAELLTTPTPIHPPTLTPTRTPSWPKVSTPVP